MIPLTLFLIALVAGFGGLIWGWRLDRRERAARRYSGPAADITRRIIATRYVYFVDDDDGMRHFYASDEPLAYIPRP